MAFNVLIAVPAFGNRITSATFLTTHTLTQAFMQRGIACGITTLSFPDIAELRSMFLTIFYDTLPQTTHLLFIDSDMGFAPDLVLEQLLLDEGVVGTIYRQRREPVSWAGSGTGEAMTPRRGNFMKVEGVGMGCTLIRRDVVTKMLETMPEIIDTRLDLHPAKETMHSVGAKRLIRAFEKIDMPERGLVSEDLSFCLRWGKCGGEVWAAVGHRVSHVGDYDYAGCYLDTINQAQQIVLPGTVMPTQPTAPIPALPLQSGTDQAPPIEVVPVTAAPEPALVAAE